MNWNARAMAMEARTIPTEVEAPAIPDFDAVYEAHVDFVWRMVARFGGGDMQEDLVQQVFIVVHRQLPGFEGRSRLRTWLYTITRRVVAEHFRRTKRRPETASVSLHTMAGEGPLPDSELSNKEDVQLLYRLLEGLTPQRREVFVLVELEGLSIPEISRALDTNENTLYARLRVARRQFNDAVSRYQSVARREEP